MPKPEASLAVDGKAGPLHDGQAPAATELHETSLARFRGVVADAIVVG